jgi:hypothetical protein
MSPRPGVERRLAGLGAAGHGEVQPRREGGLQKAGRLRRERAERDQLVEAVETAPTPVSSADLRKIARASRCWRGWNEIQRRATADFAPDVPH